MKEIVKQKAKKKHSDKLNEMYVSVNGQNDQN